MSGYVITAQDWLDAQRDEGVLLDGFRVRVVTRDGERRVQRYHTASSSDGEGWGSPVLASSHAPTQAFIDLIAAFPTDGPTDGGPSA